jgi:hypothetical protein
MNREQVRFLDKCGNDSCFELLDKNKLNIIISKLDTFYSKRIIKYKKFENIITDGKDYLIRLYGVNYSKQKCDSLHDAWYDTLPESFKKADSVNKSVGYLIEMPMPRIPKDICKECLNQIILDSNYNLLETDSCLLNY